MKKYKSFFLRDKTVVTGGRRIIYKCGHHFVRHSMESVIAGSVSYFDGCSPTEEEIPPYHSKGLCEVCRYLPKIYENISWYKNSSHMKWVYDLVVKEGADIREIIRVTDQFHKLQQSLRATRLVDRITDSALRKGLLSDNAKEASFFNWATSLCEYYQSLQYNNLALPIPELKFLAHYTWVRNLWRSGSKIDASPEVVDFLENGEKFFKVEYTLPWCIYGRHLPASELIYRKPKYFFSLDFLLPNIAHGMLEILRMDESSTMLFLDSPFAPITRAKIQGHIDSVLKQLTEIYENNPTLVSQPEGYVVATRPISYLDHYPK